MLGPISNASNMILIRICPIIVMLASIQSTLIKDSLETYLVEDDEIANLTIIDFRSIDLLSASGLDALVLTSSLKPLLFKI